jgi:hypothetical protein
MILDLFLLRVFHAPSYCSFTSNLTMFSLIIDYGIDCGIYSAFIMIIINLITDKSRLCCKITIKYWQNVLYSQLYWNKTQINTCKKKKSAYFTHPDFSAAKIEKKRAQITRANTVLCKYIVLVSVQPHRTESKYQRTQLLWQNSSDAEQLRRDLTQNQNSPTWNK